MALSSRLRPTRTVTALVLGFVLVVPGRGPAAVGHTAFAAGMLRSPGALPLTFEVNHGQAGSGGGFLARGAGFMARVTARGIKVEMTSVRRESIARSPSPAGDLVRPRVEVQHAGIELLGTRSSARVVGVGRLPGKVNYLFGNDPRKWLTDLPTYSRVECLGVYPGIDLLYLGRNGRLEYDWVVHPGARLQSIRFRVTGQGRLTAGADGSLVVWTGAGRLVQGAPVGSVEAIPSSPRPPSPALGERVPATVVTRYVRLGRSLFGLATGPYDRARTLVVDPVVRYATYVGGSAGDSAKSVAVDTEGNTYITGFTASPDFWLQNAYQSATTNASFPHVFVTKLDPTGRRPIFSTYLGGSGFDEAFAVAQDSGGVYVAGDTDSHDFPTAHAFQPTLRGNTNAFVVRLSPSGDALDYSSYLGGTQVDRAYALALDPSGNAYVTGDTVPNLNTVSANGPQPLPHAFVNKIGADGSLEYTFLLHGDFAETGYGIAADAAGDAYVVGQTQSTDFPSPVSPPPGLIGVVDAYIIKLDPTGKNLIYSTHLGGDDASVANSVAVDPAGNAYVAGQTGATNFPIAGGFQRRFGGSGDSLTPGDGFVTKVDTFGRVVYSTYLGGADDDEALGIAVDRSRNMFVTGWTSSVNFPVKDALQPELAAGPCIGGQGTSMCSDAFVTEIASNGSLAWSTFFGGNRSDAGDGIALHGSDVYIAGTTSSQDIPASANAVQTHSTDPFGASLDGYLIRLAPGRQVMSQALVINRMDVYPAGHSVSTARMSSVRPGERIQVRVHYHDGRRNAPPVDGFVSVVDGGRQISQWIMQSSRPGSSSMFANVRVGAHVRTQPLSLRIGLASDGAYAERTIRLRLVVQ